MPFGFYSSGTIIIPPMPKWPAGINGIALVDAFKTIVQRHSPGCIFDDSYDASFIAVPHAIVGPALAWTLRSLQEQGVKYTAESWDCENFVNEADQTFRKMAAIAGIKASPLTCVLTVLPHIPWAGVLATGAHAIGCVMTDLGPWVFESQNGQVCPIETYPNRDCIIISDGDRPDRFRGGNAGDQHDSAGDHPHRVASVKTHSRRHPPNVSGHGRAAHKTGTG
jgi:hypothetical protein